MEKGSIAEWVMTGVFTIAFVFMFVIAFKQFKKDKDDLTSSIRSQKIESLKQKQKKHFQKYEKKIQKVDKKLMAKENTQFSAYAMANDKVKSLIETFGEQFEVDMHEWEKNLFALAYERGYSDGKYDYKQSLMKDKDKEE